MQEKRHVVVSQPAGGKSSISFGWDEPAKTEKAHVKVSAAPGGKDSVGISAGSSTQDKAHVKVSNPPGGKSSITFG